MVLIVYGIRLAFKCCSADMMIDLKKITSVDEELKDVIQTSPDDHVCCEVACSEEMYGWFLREQYFSNMD
ncbi:hypothetical protein M758_5G045300 [Ceratodon purpureus]|nr:hypothetical protein M758_5G045300 [Ceratodon purpureus]